MTFPACGSCGALISGPGGGALGWEDEGGAGGVAEDGLDQLEPELDEYGGVAVSFVVTRRE
jgi:hypothetical protein